MTCPHCEQLRAALRAFARWLRERAAYDDAAMTAVRYVDALCSDTTAFPLQSIITWTPVSERLPSDMRSRLLATRHVDVLLGYYSDKWMAFICHSVRQPDNYITHHAELAPPPASEEEKG